MPYHTSFCIQNYFQSENLYVKQRKLLANFRAKMIKVRINFSRMYESVLCQLCVNNGRRLEGSQEHLLICELLSTNNEIDIGIQYSDIYSGQIRKQVSITVLLEQKFKLREKLLKNQVNH